MFKYGHNHRRKVKNLIKPGAYIRNIYTAHIKTLTEHTERKMHDFDFSSKRKL